MKPFITQRKLEFGAGETFHLGGHPNNLNALYKGFIGCMRYIQIDRELKQIDNALADMDLIGNSYWKLDQLWLPDSVSEYTRFPMGAAAP